MCDKSSDKLVRSETQMNEESDEMESKNDNKYHLTIHYIIL